MASLANLPEPLADSVETAAYRLGICRAQLYKEIAAGRLMVRKIGRRTLVERSAQEAWLTALPHQAPPRGGHSGNEPLSKMTEAELLGVIERAKAGTAS